MPKQKPEADSLFDGDPDDLQFGFNKEFAARLEHNKKREELHRLKEKHPELAARLERQDRQVQPELSGSQTSEEESSEDEEDEGLSSLAADRKFLRLLARIRQGDRSLYTDDAAADASSSSNEDEAGHENTRGQPKRLKDVLGEQAAAGVFSDSDDDISDSEEVRRAKEEKQREDSTYVQQQEELKNAFLQAAENSEAEPGQENFGGMLLKTSAAENAQRMQIRSQLVNQVYGSEQPLSKDDQFLKSFLLNEGWKDNDEHGIDEEAELDEDEAFEQAAEQFEAQYNFRFQEEGADRIRGHPRVPEGTVRRVDETRKRARERQAERRQAQQAQHAEEVKRLKRIHKQGVQDRLAKIQEVAGSKAPTREVMDKLMAGDFDPDQFDAAMATAFGDDYYEGEGEEGSGIEDMDFGDEGEEDDLPGADGSHGFRAMQERLQGQPGGAAAAEAVQRGTAEIQSLMQQYDALDYEDLVGGVATKFRYRTVPKADYGLDIAEVLQLPDKDLNQVVGLKRLAPYRDDGGT
ncbi:hypothetical protein WJX73_002256 [Symbiochloris irregularis]|uniref:Kri1-like C-terminal domain-containing protein n=1 Tax=Symbiochloris irregularis TaxID=706552 RepID=A0AAW1NPL3_9CHLO